MSTKLCLCEQETTFNWDNELGYGKCVPPTILV